MKTVLGHFSVFSCTFIASCWPQPPPPINRSFDDEGYRATLHPNIFSSFFPPSPADRRHQSNILLPLPDVEGYFCEIQSRCSAQTKHKENQATGAIELMKPLFIAKVFDMFLLGPCAKFFFSELKVWSTLERSQSLIFPLRNIYSGI